jgi:Tol biopolymer transport system component
MIGTTIGPYRVLDKLGEGGMGQVYRARDTTLDRDVALKILPESVADDPDRVARFKREAKALAALNHQNIAHIYGVEGPALVMELIEGEDLSAIIARGPIVWADALPIARQIADALEAAHELGIVHRDLKPANIKVRPDGAVKVLDFGLAKALDPNTAAAAADLANSPTLTARATQLGVILGTAAYMAPEQAKGKPVDKRADIWAFGVVLYEMLTGLRAFEGEDVSTTLAAVLMREPQWGSLPAETPPAVKALIRRCLDRDPKTRLRDIGEARVILRDPTATTIPPVPMAGSAVSARRPSALWWLVAAVGVAIAAIAGAWGARWFQPATANESPIRLAVDTPDATFGAALFFSLSPDGRSLAFVAPHPTSGTNVIWVRSLGDLTARPLNGTEGALSPFWAPNSRHLGFAAGGKLKTTDVTGGVPQFVCDLSVSFLGGTWNFEGTILFAHGATTQNASLARVSEQGGRVTDVLQPDRSQDQIGLSWPAFLSDGHRFLYLAWSNVLEKRAIFAGSLDGGTPSLLLKSSTAAVPTAGFLLTLRETVLEAYPFDERRLTLSGEPVRLAQSVLYNRTNGRAAFAASGNVIAFREGSLIDAVADLAWLNRSGQSLGLIGDPGPYNQVRLSPDEKRAALALPDIRPSGFNVWILDFASKIMTQLTFENTANDPMWSPDGQSLAFEATPKGKRDFYRQVVGARAQSLIFESPDDPKWLDDWSRDGTHMLFHVPRPGKIYALPMTGERTPMLLFDSKGNVDGVHFSPDGKWIAYQDNASGQYEVWVAAFPAFDHRRRVSSHGGGEAMWRADGRELFYLTADGKMMSVPATPVSKDELDFGAPSLLFQTPIARPQLGTDQYAVTRDGQRFLMIQPRRDQSSATAPITVVVNWMASPRKRP